MQSLFENHPLKDLERRAKLGGKHRSLVLLVFAICASPTEIDVCIGFFYLMAAKSWQLGCGEEDTQRALCTHTLFGEPFSPAPTQSHPVRIYSNSCTAMPFRKRPPSGSPKPPARTANAVYFVSCSFSAHGQLRLFLPKTMTYLVLVVQYKFVSLSFQQNLQVVTIA